jgi:hypothetical protein
MWSLEMEGGGGAGIPARCSPERAEEGEERGLGVTYDRSAAGVGVRRHRRRGHRGAIVHWPLRMGASVGWQPGRAMRGSGSSQGPQVKHLGGWVAGKLGRQGSSA